MTRTATHADEEHGAKRRRKQKRSSQARSAVRRFGVLHTVAGLLGLVGPAVWENDDDGLVNIESGLFLGVVAVNGPHALLHVLWGLLGLRASREEDSARKHAKRSTVLFGVFAAIGWRKFGFERGVHYIAGLAVDGWGNLGHAIISVLGLRTVLRSQK